MLSELLHSGSVIHIGGREYRVRYSLNALLCLEQSYMPIEKILETDYRLWDIETCLQLCRAAMCDLEENHEAVRDRRWDMVTPDLAELGRAVRVQDLGRLRTELADAVINSLPEAEDGAKASSDQTADEGHMRALFCDIMGVPEEEFWNSSYRDITKRTNKYLEAKGLKEMPLVIKMTDKND